MGDMLQLRMQSRCHTKGYSMSLMRQNLLLLKSHRAAKKKKRKVLIGIISTLMSMGFTGVVGLWQSLLEHDQRLHLLIMLLKFQIYLKKALKKMMIYVLIPRVVALLGRV